MLGPSTGPPPPLVVRRHDPRRDVRLDDRYVAQDGPVLLSGIQALVRATLDVRRLDRRRGRDTAVYVSGYQGSPLAGLDQELERARAHLEPAGIVARPGLNEELAATAVGGTQLLDEVPGRRHDGVVGFWFGKSPGLDRATDAIRHANLSGAAPLGGAVAWIGDDPASKSSTVPSSCEPLCRSLMVPVLTPGSVQELLEASVHAVELSRHAGTWCAVKVVADLADATATVDVGRTLDAIPDLPVRVAGPRPVLLPPTNLDAELDLMEARLDRAAAYARAAGLNRIVAEPSRPRLAIVAAGLAFAAVVRALDDLGVDADARERLGIRLVRVGMPWPLPAADLRDLTSGVERVLVVEDKLPFLEPMVRDAHYRRADAPLVVGRRDADDRPLLPARGSVGADDVAVALRRLLGSEIPAGGGVGLPATPPAVPDGPPLPRRTPYFCSGCPHDVSTRADADRLVGVGIGCHTMVALDGEGRRGRLLGMPQMGGEGAQWLGLAPFVDDPHFVQNMGDGTFHHSGSLAVRAAVAAGVSMTFRLLHNDAVAMTGGQEPTGGLGVPRITRWLEVEGVSRVVVTTPDPRRYRRVRLASIAEVRHRDRLPETLRELAATPGVTVLIHDDECAAQKRRRRKRGLLPVPAERAWINERVCEGCGDCGDVSSCLSVQPVQTELGRKTRIHQSSCNQDMTCLEGDCPSFLLVTPDPRRRPRPVPDVPFPLPDPVRRVGDDVLVRMPGIGGTGVVTVSQVLQMAAHLEGRHAAGLEQIGLAQKGGPVLSDVRFGSRPVEGQLRAGRGRVDVLLGLDLLGAASPDTLAVADPTRTIAVLNRHHVPTAAEVTRVDATAMSLLGALRRIRAVTRREDELAVDAGTLSERLFADHMPTNMILVGAALQHGALPLDVASVERAIELNGAAVATNLAALRWGRALAVDADAAWAAIDGAPTGGMAPGGGSTDGGAADDHVAGGDVDGDATDHGSHRSATATVDRVLADASVDARDLVASAGPSLRRILDARIPELVAWQDDRTARAYLDDVARVAAIERERTGTTAVAEAFARGLFHLTAYKDEYEIARLHRDGIERARVVDAYGPRARVRVLLQPPLLRTLGLRRKVALDGRWLYPALGVLYRLRRLRGTVLDPFGHARVRRLERALAAEYRRHVDAALAHLAPETVGDVTTVAAAAGLVRGYEAIKVRNVEAFRARVDGALERLDDASPEGRRPPRRPESRGAGRTDDRSAGPAGR
ncbi:MAG: indolepyruvate ferredoxin oxidoreductase family protein [Solirubrobacteraceae bacterium]|nr:indolepyruvate ferredoxin oxidoreductase family protein [Solirubrobacteraceae bacterium]